ncbi:hypothetical protein Ddye_014553 [Dipteronia dyeriana]|uniref:PGG domain-containing protein n=1 Tax=Dipteronia dyeriana TaxID=168575 RepID=A0AAD9X8I1_9ROSI|nr:hypothetical protein Ddye_014553 [Dipteronia dyeriana]
MDPRVFNAIAENDFPSFIRLVQEDEGILDQRLIGSLNTVLHLASKYGHINLVREIIQLRPEMAAAENKKLEIPLHEACRQGDIEVVMLLLKTNPWLSCKFNSKNQSALFIACSNGHLNVVKILLNQPWFVGIEEDEAQLNSLHVAATKGYVDIVGHLLNLCPNLAHNTDVNGYSPLHYACSKGQVSIATMLLRFDLNLALQFDYIGYTPLHLAAMNGDLAILQEFVALAPASFQFLTTYGETVFHLAARFNHYIAFIYLATVFCDTYLFHQPDKFGNTSLHIAISGGNYHLAEKIIDNTKIEINYRNYEGHTALYILNQAQGTSEVQHLKDQMKKAGGKTDIELLQTTVIESPRDALERTFEQILETLSPENEHSGPLDHLGNIMKRNQKKHYEKKPEDQDNDVSEPDSSSSRGSQTNVHETKHESLKHRKELIKIYNRRNTKQHDAYTEALQNARNTITLVAILIATVTFTAGVSPPGGVYQEGPKKGKSVVARTTAFKVFTVSNNIALFTSLCTVIVLVSIIPFRRKPLMRLLMIAHKVMWVAVAFMATAYVAATWVTMPHNGNMWTFGVLVSICSGTLGSVFICLGVYVG